MDHVRRIIKHYEHPSSRYIRPYEYPPCSVNDKPPYSRMDTLKQYNLLSPMSKIKLEPVTNLRMRKTLMWTQTLMSKTNSTVQNHVLRTDTRTFSLLEAHQSLKFVGR